ncbi:Pkinase-domain-containing protein, partial [Ramaria rubella]
MNSSTTPSIPACPTPTGSHITLQTVSPLPTTPLPPIVRLPPPPRPTRIARSSRPSPPSPCPAPPSSSATPRAVSRPFILARSPLLRVFFFSASTRSWTPLKVVGDGSFGTVWLCDWHGALPPDTPLSPMQCGAGARAEWSGKRLVAVKRMKKKWEGGWDECRRLKELESLRAIPSHPNIIPLYDSFLLPATKELYFVFESMEGNLYQLIKSRKGRPLAGGLVSSIYSQVVNGLCHIHDSGYFHRDMKPENLLVTTTGLADYQPTSPMALPGAPPEKDVVVIIKLADFGLARETRSRPPYTEYVSTRWYRAPEVLLRSRDYSNPVDMWALGTILAELINLKPLFPGAGEIDQVARICDVLGDPNHNYGVDDRGRGVGGGVWMRGVQMAKQVGFKFPELSPKHFRSFFDPSVPSSLIDCIEDLLRYDPEARLTSKECLNHPYLIET